MQKVGCSGGKLGENFREIPWAAAIVARELGLPCVVGAKFATKSLMAGDKVEIDAETGIIRKIK